MKRHTITLKHDAEENAYVSHRNDLWFCDFDFEGVLGVKHQEIIRLSVGSEPPGIKFRRWDCFITTRKGDDVVWAALDTWTAKTISKLLVAWFGDETKPFYVRVLSSPKPPAKKK